MESPQARPLTAAVESGRVKSGSSAPASRSPTPGAIPPLCLGAPEKHFAKSKCDDSLLSDDDLCCDYSSEASDEDHVGHPPPRHHGHSPIVVIFGSKKRAHRRAKARRNSSNQWECESCSNVNSVLDPCCNACGTLDLDMLEIGEGVLQQVRLEEKAEEEKRRREKEQSRKEKEAKLMQQLQFMRQQLADKVAKRKQLDRDKVPLPGAHSPGGQLCTPPRVEVAEGPAPPPQPPADGERAGSSSPAAVGAPAALKDDRRRRREERDDDRKRKDRARKDKEGARSRRDRRDRREEDGSGSEERDRERRRGSSGERRRKKDRRERERDKDEPKKPQEKRPDSRRKESKLRLEQASDRDADRRHADAVVAALVAGARPERSGRQGRKRASSRSPSPSQPAKKGRTKWEEKTKTRDRKGKEDDRHDGSRSRRREEKRQRLLSVAKDAEEIRVPDHPRPGINRGVVHHIATTQGRHMWQNPYQDGVINASASTCGMGDVSHVLNYKFDSGCRFATFEAEGESEQQVKPSYVAFDFTDFEVLPTHYSIAHAWNHQLNYIRSWSLRGSEDNYRWDILSKHINDDTIRAENLTHTFRIATPESPKFYRYFMIRLETNGNSSRSNQLVVNCFDLYGYLRKREKDRKRGGGVKSSGKAKPSERERGSAAS
eukprot:TRINITY_DN7282_c0_g3_i1.p1 TRINITY_DN7282_c0_g3~~TRINITY_DN7282_c0_g3_i1.p1  ORF type:complete len:660 (+),score=245.93 TRINITY_DN7282_c0_g3_i1:375-2354(+)